MRVSFEMKPARERMEVIPGSINPLLPDVPVEHGIFRHEDVEVLEMGA